ncbi:MAG: hypothetical protein PHU21_14395, partial [Elusimicrobia bacterium]|nr:hypothetical protein [Elusimicrobiota bacterium]
DASLHDTSAQPAFVPAYLGAQVAAVQFQSDQLGQLVVLTLGQDGSTRAFDRYGTSLDVQYSQQSSGEAAEAATVGASLEKSALFNALKTGNIAW